MSNDKATVFFYGLFMDVDLLREQGILLEEPTVAILKGYGFRLSARATLILSKNEYVYGVVGHLDKNDLVGLYSAESVSDYVAENVSVAVSDGSSTAALCYILPYDAESPTSQDYAKKLATVAEKVGLPAAYLDILSESLL